jgi:peroxiredoxin
MRNITGMRRIAIALLALSFSSLAASGQPSKVGDGFMLLTQEPDGWHVDNVNRKALKNLLEPDDVISRIDARDAGSLGPLAVRLIYGSAFERTIPLQVQRGGRSQKVDLWLSDGPAPPDKPDPATLKDVSLAEAAPDFALPALDGSTTRLSALKGKWVLVSFWATWCGPCMQEEPIFNRLADDYKAKLTILALALKETHASLESFSAKYKPHYTILDAGSLKGPVALAYGVTRPGASSVPISVLVRPDGTIAYVHGGYEAPSPLEARIRDAIAGH